MAPVGHYIPVANVALNQTCNELRLGLAGMACRKITTCECEVEKCANMR